MAEKDFPEKFLEISSINGVDQYILLDPDGKVVTHDMKDPEGTAEMVFSSVRDMTVLGGSRFKYALFSRKQGEDMIVFSCAPYCLGVMVRTPSPLTLAENLLKFLCHTFTTYQDLDRTR